MATQPLRRSKSARAARRKQPALLVRPLCSPLEDRIAPALFTVKNPVTINSQYNFGCVATGDFNGDGKTDMVLTNYGTAAPGADPPNNAGGSKICVLLGNGDGTFGGSTNITVGTDQYVAFVAVGDLNGDGKQDLAVVSNNEDTTGELRIYIGNGSGGFTLSSQGAISTGSNNASWVGIAPMISGDPNLDVVVGSFGYTDSGQTTIIGNNVVLFQGDGTGAVNNIGTFSDGIQFVPTALALADFNGDGKMDIAAAYPGVPPDTTSPQPNGFVQLLTGDGAGGFTFGNSFDSGGALPTSIATTDFNGDGKPDLVIANAGDPDTNNFYANFGTNSSIGVAINTGGGSFNTSTLTAGIGAPNTGTSTSVFAVTTADFNGDGKPDIAGILFGDPFGSTRAKILEYKGNGDGTFNPDANSPYDTLTVYGQFLAAAPIDGNSTPDIVYCTANGAGKYGVLINNTTPAAPTVTINQASSQVDPTNGTSIQFSVVFSSPVTGFGDVAGDVDLSGSTGGGAGLIAQVTPTDASHYTVTVTGMTGIGFVKAAIPAGAATAISGGQSTQASTSTDNQVTYDYVAPTVTINQATGQADPTTTSPIQFTVVFSENVVGFIGSDISFAGSTVGGTLVASVSGSGANYTVSVSGMSGGGTVIASIPAGAATDAAGNQSGASTSTDNTVTFGNGPTVTINQAVGQADPTNQSPITFTVHFSQPVTGFDGSDISFAGSTVGGILQANVTGSSQDFTVTVTGMSGSGTVVASIPAGAAVNGSNIGNQPSTSSDNSVFFDGVAPTVTINQAAGQSDPTTLSPIKFDVTFSKNVTGFDGSDINFAGSTAGGTLVATVIQNTPSSYTVNVTGMTTGGNVIASIPAGAAVDSVGNASLASTSSDNSVRFMNTGVLGFSQAVFNGAEDDVNNTTTFVTVTVSRTVAGDGAVSIDYATSDGTAHSGGPANKGQNDYTPTTGTLHWNDGELGDKTFTVPILSDTFNEGWENINLNLTNATGLANLGQTSAVVRIAPSDGQGPGKYLDQDNDKYTITLSGKTGSLLYYRDDPDGDGKGPIALIQLTGTLPDPLRPRASLSISVTSPKFGSDKLVSIGAITGTGLRSITARKSDLIGSSDPLANGINLNGDWLGSLTINNVLNGADIKTGATPNPLQKTRIRAAAIGNGTDITVGTGLSGLTALSMGNGSLTAPNVGTISVRGNWAADVNISGVGVMPGRNVLSAFIVRGIVSDTNMMVNGNVGTVSVGAFRTSRLFAGYTGADDGTGIFSTVPARISSFRSSMLIEGFENSWVIADTIKSARITNLVSHNSTEFGFFADTKIGVVRVVGPLPWAYDPTVQTGQQGFDQFVTEVV
jgi:hypothetical protein